MYYTDHYRFSSLPYLLDSCEIGFIICPFGSSFYRLFSAIESKKEVISVGLTRLKANLSFKYSKILSISCIYTGRHLNESYLWLRAVTLYRFIYFYVIFYFPLIIYPFDLNELLFKDRWLVTTLLWFWTLSFSTSSSFEFLNFNLILSLLTFRKSFFDLSLFSYRIYENLCFYDDFSYSYWSFNKFYYECFQL